MNILYLKCLLATYVVVEENTYNISYIHLYSNDNFKKESS